MKGKIYKYKLNVDIGNVTECAKDIRAAICENEKNRNEIREAFSHNFVFLGNCYYTPNLIEKPLEFKMKDNKVIIQ